MAKQKAKTVDMSVSEEELQNIELPEEAEKRRLKELKAAEKAAKEAKKAAKEAEKEAIQEKIEDQAKEVKTKTNKGVRSKRYQAARAKVDRTKTYAPKQAVDLLLKTSYSSFTGTISADLVVKDLKTTATFAYPHSTGKSIKVAIADDALLKQIDSGTIDFDVLLAEPKMMPKIAKYARVLGPKGLMPNPKNNTVTAEPEKRKKELEGGKLTIKTEKKAPLIHTVLGKTDMKAADVLNNIEALIKALGPRKVLKLVLSATMSPGIKVDLSSYQA